MSRMEDDLRKALAREEPGEEFADRVLARIAAQAAKPAVAAPDFWTRLADFFRMPGMRLAAAAALCLTLVVGVNYEQERRARERGEEAKQKLMLALRITSSKLEMTRDRVRAIGERE